MKRTIVIGDVHGCLEELDELLKKVEFEKGKDRLIFAGDLVDRGPDSAGVVRRVQELDAECVMGNHDDKYVRYSRHALTNARHPEYKNPMHFSPQKLKVFESLSWKDLIFLSNLPIFIRLRHDLVVLHGGVTGGETIEAHNPKLTIRLRFVSPSGESLKLEKDYSEPAGSVFWTKLWTGPESIIYGHNVDNLMEPRIDNPKPGVWCFGIDTGSCFGGRLTAMVLTDLDGLIWQHSFVQVQAKAEYVPRKRAMDEE